MEVLLPFAAAEINAETGRIDLALFEPGVAHGLGGRADGKAGVPTVMLPGRRIFTDGRNVPVANFGRDLGGKATGVKQRRVADARRSGQQLRPGRLHIAAQGSDAADSGNYDSSSHKIVASSR